MKKIKYVCKKCKSENIVKDAWAEWDTQNQYWTLRNVFDAVWCDNCEGETSLIEVEI